MCTTAPAEMIVPTPIAAVVEIVAAGWAITGRPAPRSSSRSQVARRCAPRTATTMFVYLRMRVSGG
jgi:hypothetical protein